MKKTKSTFEIRIRLQSFYPLKLEALKKQWKVFALEHHIVYSSIGLPIDKKRFTLLKSPHVNKKAREQFEFRISSCLIILKGFDFNLFLFGKLQKMVSVADVSTKFTLLNKHV